MLWQRLGRTRVAAALLLASAAMAAEPEARLVLQTGHGIISNAVYAPGADVVFTAAPTSVVAWTRDSGKKLYELQANWHNLRALAFPVDGGRRVLLTAGDIKGGFPARTAGALWEIETGRKIRDLPYQVIDACEDGSLVWALDSEQSSSIRDGLSGRVVLKLPFRNSPTLLLANPRMACTADRSRVLLDRSPAPPEMAAAELWDIRGQRRISAFVPPLPVSVFAAMALSPDGRTVLTIAPGETEVHVWEAETGKEIRRLSGFGAPLPYTNALRMALAEKYARVLVLKFSPDGSRILTAGTDGNWRLWDTAAGRILKTDRFRGRFSGVEWITTGGFSADGKELLLGCEDEAIAQGVDQAQPRVGYRGIMAPSASYVLSPDGRYLFHSFSIDFFELGKLGKAPLPLVYWDLSTGGFGEWARLPEVTAVAFSADSRWMATGDVSGKAILWEMAGRRQQRVFEGAPGSTVTAMAVSPDGKRVVVGFQDGAWNLFDVASGALVHSAKEKLGLIGNLQFSPDGSRFVLGTTGSTDLFGGTGVFDASNGSLLLNIPSGGRRGSAVFTPDGRYLLCAAAFGEVGVWDLAKGYQVRKLIGGVGVVWRTAVSSDSKYALVAAQGVGRGIILWEIGAAKPVRELLTGTDSNLTGLAFLPDGNRAIAGHQDGSLEFFDVTTGKPLCSLFLVYGVEPGQASWVTVAPDGRFDANNLDAELPLHWVVSDRPTSPLPLEVFMKDYFEPRLLPRLLAGEKFAPIAGIGSRNRLLPVLKFGKAIKEAGTQDVIALDVQLEETRDPKTAQRSGIDSVRLFREGKLVAMAPGPGQPLTIDDTGRASIRFPNIRLPQNGTNTVSFSVYAFNSDGVKSQTVRKVYARSNQKESDLVDHVLDFGPRPPARRGQAFLVNIGVNASAVPRLSLKFAANDARLLGERLASELQASGKYASVNPIRIIADSGAPNGASKVAIRSALEKLAGEVRPEDLVIVSFSGHGYADESGRFYLIPSDAGRGLTSLSTTPGGRLLVQDPKRPSPMRDLLAASVSSDELSEWLRRIDAGEMVLIIDACQSAASVSGEGFKPGPMGSRGLGQLAYDKGMVVLAATQADNVALESKQIGQGLLTFALAKDGLERRGADWQPKDGKITLIEWLRYGVERVPSLYEELLHGTAAQRAIQEPALFDFSHSSDPVISATQPR